MITDAHRNFLIEVHAVSADVIEHAGIDSHPKGIKFRWSDGTREIFQARLDDQFRRAGAPRYLWPEGEAPVINRLREPANGEAVILAEGTCQHLAVASWTDEKIGVFGVMGCWGWSGCDLSWAEDRDVIVMFDADLESNRDVHDAAKALKNALELEGVRSIKFVPPPGRGKDGIDDVLARRPADTRAVFLTRLIAKAAEKLGRPPSKRKDADDPEKIAKLIMDRYPVALTAEQKIAIYKDGAYRREQGAFNAIAVEILGPDFWPSIRDAAHDFLAGTLFGTGRVIPDRVSEPLLNVRNGMLDLRTGELLDHDPKYLSAVQLPVAWNPDATAPTYEAWLQDVIPLQIDDLEESVSMMLDPSRTPPKAIFLFGPSRSGKSTFLRLAAAIAGDSNTSAVSLQQLVENRFAAVNVYGKILNAAAELRAGHIDDLTIFKQMTGDDPIEAERKYVQPFSFHNGALFAFAANELPTVGESSRAYSERIKPFKFAKSFAGAEDPKLEKAMMTELEGILKRWVTGWQTRNERGRYLPTHPSVSREFETRSDRVRQFVEECCVLNTTTVAKSGGTVATVSGMLLPPSEVTSKREVFRAFDDWVQLNKGTSLKPTKVFDRLTSINGVVEVRNAVTKSRGLNITVKPRDQWGEHEEDGDRWQGGNVAPILPPSSLSTYSENDQSHDQQEREGDRDMGEDCSNSATLPPIPGAEGAEPQVNVGAESVAQLPPDSATPSYLTVDLETATPDQMFRREDFVRLGAYANGNGPVLTTDAGEIVSQMDGPYVITGHNLTGFDLIALARWHGLSLPDLRDKVADTDLLVRLDDPPPSGKDGIAIRPKGYYGLDQSCARYGVGGKTDDLGTLAKEFGGYDQIPTDDPRYRAYLTGDIYASTALINALPPMNTYAKREQNVGLITAQMTVNGFRVDVPELHRALEEQAIRKADHIAELASMTGTPTDRKSPIATKAGKEAIERALIECGIPESGLPRTEKSGVLQTSSDAMKDLKDKIELTRKMTPVQKDRALRIIELIVSINGERTVYQTADTCRIDDRVHPSIRPYQASGRWSVTSPGLTVYGKRDGRYVERRIFLPEEGHRLLAVDLDQVDARAVAAHSGDANYIKIFTDGLDLHGEVAKAIFGDAKFREISKPISHGWNYGRGARAVSESTGIPLDMTTKFDREMRQRYPQLVEWQEHVRRIASDGDLLDNGFGRMMRADPRFAYTQAPALVGQGCTRDILAEGMLRLPVEVWPMLRVIVHDELVLSVPEDDFEDVARVVKESMSFDFTGPGGTVPITAGVSKPGRTWSEVYEK
jgi:P4 family phage/plasmid primase-like protien